MKREEWSEKEKHIKSEIEREGGGMYREIETERKKRWG